MASVRPRATARPSPTPSPAGTSPSRWNGSKIVSRRLGGHARSVVDHPQAHPRPDAVLVQADAGDRDRRRVGVLEGVLDDVGDHPLEQARIGGHRRQVVGRGDRDRLGARSRRRSVHSATEARSTSALRAVSAGLQPAHVEQVGHQGVQPVGGLLDRGQQLLLGPAADQTMAVLRRLEEAALIAASGVRRSWDTAASSAVLVRLPSAAPGSGRRPPAPGGAPPGPASGRRTRSAGARRPPTAGPGAPG